VAAGSRRFAFGTADLLMHRCDHEPAVAEFASHPAGIKAGNDVGLKLVQVAAGTAG
jgi:hypothetical protein